MQEAGVRTEGFAEFALYVADIERSRDFYQRVFGFQTIFGEGDRLRALAAPNRAVLLLFRAPRVEDLATPGGLIPGHGASGNQHFALWIARDAIAGWLERLEGLEIPVESRVKWQAGGESLYFRDPDGHSVELVTPGSWRFPDLS